MSCAVFLQNPVRSCVDAGQRAPSLSPALGAETEFPETEPSLVRAVHTLVNFWE